MMEGSTDVIKLTHEHLHHVACSLTSKSDIRKLTLKLGVKANKMESIFCNKNGDIEEAAYEMLKEWRKGQGDPRRAFITLRDALSHPDVNLYQVAQEALDTPFDRIKDRSEWLDSILHQENCNGCHNNITLEGRFCGHHLLSISVALCKDDMKRLTPELDISSEEVNASYAKHCRDRTAVTAANHDLLKGWLNRQNSREEAYVLMGEALIRAGLNLIAKEVLHYPPAERENEIKYGVKRKKRNRDRDQRKKLKKADGLSVRP